MSTRKRYPSDLTNREWQQVQDLVPLPKPGGRPAKYSRREILDAIIYSSREGCSWRALPHDYPPYRIVFHYYRAWQSDGTWNRIHDRLRMRVRKAAGKLPKPSVGIVDSQTVETTEMGGVRGYA